jgi:hypothetical protein
MCPFSHCFFIGLLFVPEDGSDTFLRNMRMSLNYTVLQLRRHCSEILIPSMVLLLAVFSVLLLMYMIHCSI